MNKLRKQQDSGFTIIEVVLVLAIAALIMLMVFLALPALQRGQRDTSRKNDVSRLQSAINNYKSSARGALPPAGTGTNGLTNTGASGFLSTYLRKNGDQFADPTGGDYVLQSATSNQTYSDASSNVIYFNLGGTCGDGQNPTYTTTGSTSARKLMLIKPLEGGGQHCAEA